MIRIFGFTILNRHERNAEFDVMWAAYVVNQAIWLYGENNPVPPVIEEARLSLAEAISFLPAEDQAVLTR